MTTGLLRFHLPPWRFTVFCASVFLICLALAYWQHQRAQLKQGLQDIADARITTQPMAGHDLVTRDAQSLVWRPVQVTGTYDQDGQFLIDNRIQNSRPGFHVITPLALPRARWILVNRGWMPLPTVRNSAVPPPAPLGIVTIAGLLAPDAGKVFQLGEDLGSNAIWQNLIISDWNQRTNQVAAPVVLLATIPGDGLSAVADAPDYRAWVSRGYRLEWLAFAIIAAVGWVAVAMRKPGT